MKTAYWETTPLTEMTTEQWEGLCDNCARCCLHKFEDEDSAEVAYTDVVCRLLDHETGHCTDYANRQQRVPSCLHITLEKPEIFRWLPDTCAYRLLYENKPLFPWHPLISGTYATVVDAGISVQDACMVETYIHPDEITFRRAHWIDCSPLDTEKT